MKATPHIEVTDASKIAKTVLMPGDPLRAQYIADTYLENVEQFNQVRGMYGFTGTYKGRKISVMGSGMGMPSIGIYSYELFQFYGVENIIRIGSAGAYDPNLKLFDVVIAKEAYSESSYALTQNGETRDVLSGSSVLSQKLLDIANEKNIPVHFAKIHSSDIFYREGDSIVEKMYQEKGCVCVEMESFALFHNANVLGKHAACILTISDSLVNHTETTSKQRQTAFHEMIQIALEMAE
ncbi:MAG: purine-nucleoside phosphorylase [Prevotella sp.]|nr:purine-nucleoside phosphorylase [Staphylococcus sp.]MCM1349943.1 purine-nucleoside phosphorylase [Prevotella sp.]